MNKFPFTPTGVAAMCQHFFELPDAALQGAAAELGKDFPNWVQNTFVLTESQYAYLTNIAANATAFMAANASFALANRLPIVLAKEETQKMQAMESKLTKPESKLAASILPDGSFTAEGEFVIAITY